MDPYGEIPGREKFLHGSMFSQVEPKTTFNQTTYQQGFNSGAEKTDTQKAELEKIADLVKRQRQGRTIEKLQPLQAIVPNTD